MSENYQFDYLVFILRAQPFHIGHKEVIESALKISRKVIIMIGSAGKPRSIKNPWTYDERQWMIQESLNQKDDLRPRIIYAPLYDQTYNDQKWATGVQQIVDEQLRYRADGGKVPCIGITGHSKDSSSYYLKMFPQWKLVEHPMNELVSATDLRDLLFEGKNIKFLQGLLPLAVFNYVAKFATTKEFAQLIKEYKYIKDYRRGWEVAPYPPTFVTVDSCVIQSGHVLLIKRKAEPGANLLALPGGFINQTELLEDAMLRELHEETRLKVPVPVLRGSIVRREVFDAPERSLRGRTITHVYLIELPPGELPVVKGSDDAVKAMWIPLGELKEENMFEDHYAIIQRLVGSV